MPTDKKKKTLKQIHDELTTVAADKRASILKKLEFTSTATFYAILYGTKKLKDIEKNVIAEEYGYRVDEIDWLEPNPVSNIIG